MQRFRERVASLPLGWLFVIMALFFGAFTWLLGPLGTGESLTLWSLFAHLVGGVIFGALMTLFLARQRRRVGHPSVAFAISRAMKSGTLPDDTETEGWFGAIDHFRKQLRISRIFSPILFALFLVLDIVLVITGSWIFIVFGVLFAAMLIWSLVSPPRQLARLAALEAKLRSPGRLTTETSGDLHP